MENKTSVAILMATYNGAQYLRAQIDSILLQSCKDWTLYVHDDGSKDDTLKIVKEYSEKYDKQIVLLDYPSQGGACQNFLSMLAHVNSPYYMFSDQDDVWHKNKIETELSIMRAAEKMYGAIPLMVYCDLQIVDKNLNILAPSFWKISEIYPEYLNTFEHCAVFPSVTGCTMMINKKALQKVDLSPKYAIMHDAWVALTVFKHGRGLAIHKSLIDYRQHGNNAVGVLYSTQVNFCYRIKNMKSMFIKNLRQWRMARALGFGSLVMYYKGKMQYKWYCRLRRKQISSDVK